MTIRQRLTPGVNEIELAPVPAPQPLQVLFGSATNTEQLNLAAGTRVVLDPSFAAGGDTINIPGSITSFFAERRGLNVLITDNASLPTTITIPIGNVGVVLNFADANGLILRRAGSVGSTVTLGSYNIDGISRQLGGQSLVGTIGDDSIVGGAASDTMIGLSGSDTLEGAAGNDVLNGGPGLDLLDGGSGSDRYIYAVLELEETEIVNDTGMTPGDEDVIEYDMPSGSGGQLTDANFVNKSGIERLKVTGGNNAGVDITLGANALLSGVKIIDIGDQQDLTLEPSFTASVTINGAATGGNDIRSSSGNDIITIRGALNQVRGGAGNDTINGGADNDFLSGEAGDDLVVAGTGDDTVIGGTDTDTLTGGAGIDRFRFSPTDTTLAISDVLTDFRAAGGDNNGALDVIELSGTAFVPGNQPSMQNLSGSADLNAALSTAAASNSIDGGVIVFVWGGDTYFYREAIGNGTAYVSTDFLLRIPGTPFGLTAPIATLTGGINVTLTAAGTLNGSFGADMLTGSSGNDVLNGGAGIDTIDGGGSNDTITGAAGNDVLTGGAGRDQFAFIGAANAGLIAAANGIDIINDFVPGDAADTLKVFGSTAPLGDVSGGAFVAPLATIQASGQTTLRIIVITDPQPTWTTAAAVEAGLNSAFGFVNRAAIIVFQTASGGNAQVWYDSNVSVNDAGSGVAQLATLTGLTNLALLNANNFV